MEDLFQIVFIIIFIVASLISSMKKKKKAQNIPASKPKPVDNQLKTQIPKAKQKSGSEILEQILGFKLDLPEPPKKEAPNYSYDNVPAYDNSDSYDRKESYDTTWNPEESYNKNYEEKNEDGRSNYAAITSAKKEQYSSDKEKYSSFKKEVPLVTQTSKKIKPNRIKKIIADKSHLKDYIVIQEVLNKPKALRR